MIRRLCPDDKDIYVKMAIDFYHSSAVSHPIPMENITKSFDHMVNDGTYMQGFMLEDDNTPAGFCTVSLTYSQEAGGQVLWIEDFYVLPEHRSKGMGREFFRFLKNEFPEAVRWRLEITEENEGAKRLYERTGFEVCPYIGMICEDPQ